MKALSKISTITGIVCDIKRRKGAADLSDAACNTVGL